PVASEPPPATATAPADRRGPLHVRQRSLLVAALMAGAAKQLAVLLLGHALASLLDDRTHRKPQFCRPAPAGMMRRSECAARGDCTEICGGTARVRRHGRPVILHRPAGRIAVRE